MHRVILALLSILMNGRALDIEDVNVTKTHEPGIYFERKSDVRLTNENWKFAIVYMGNKRKFKIY